jgi:hypothetical protein
MKKFYIGYKIYPITDYVNILPLSVTLTLEVGMHLLRMTHCLIIVTICAKYFQNPWSMKKVWTGHKIYHETDYVNLWPQSVTLILEVGDRLSSIYKIPSKKRKFLTVHDIYPKIDNVDLNEQVRPWPWRDVGVWLLHMSHCLIVTNICAKLFLKFLW